MTNVQAVKQALAALAAGDQATTGYQQVIDEGRTATTDVDAAARFVDRRGVEQVRTAVARAERAGDADAADRGRAVLATIARFRAATAAESDATCAAVDDDHFHSARGTPLPRAGQPPGRD